MKCMHTISWFEVVNVDHPKNPGAETDQQLDYPASTPTPLRVNYSALSYTSVVDETSASVFVLSLNSGTEVESLESLGVEGCSQSLDTGSYFLFPVS